LKLFVVMVVSACAACGGGTQEFVQAQRNDVIAPPRFCVVYTVFEADAANSCDQHHGLHDGSRYLELTVCGSSMPQPSQHTISSTDGGALLYTLDASCMGTYEQATSGTFTETADAFTYELTFPSGIHRSSFVLQSCAPNFGTITCSRT
jgi:hypothetical protein